jgi:hypothetical protein
MKVGELLFLLDSSLKPDKIKSIYIKILILGFKNYGKSKKKL